MGRPVPPTGSQRLLDRVDELLWRLHDGYHARILPSRAAAHLSDELLALPIADLPPIPEEIVNDGAYFANWLVHHGGELRYARGAVVRIATPRRFADLVEQRRRILRGHRQLWRRYGLEPATLQALARRDPSAALSVVRAVLAGQDRALSALAGLALAEVTAHARRLWDDLVGSPESPLWPRVSVRVPTPTRDRASRPEAPHSVVPAPEPTQSL